MNEDGPQAGAASQAHPDVAELRRAHQRLRRAFDSSPIGMSLVDLSGRWMDVNAALCELVGYTRDELLALRFQDITHPEDLEADLDLVRRTVAGELPGYQLQKRYLHRLGQVIWIRLTVSLVRDDSGEPLHFVSQIEDVTRQRQVEEELRESKRRLQAMFDSIPAGLSLRDLDGRYLSVNRFAAGSLGVEPESLVGVDPAEHLDAATRDEVRRQDMRVVAARRPIVSDIQVQGPDGARDWHVVRYPIIDDDDNVSAIGAFSLDVTERRRDERAHVAALEEVAEAQRLARIGSWRWDTKADVATWSDEMYRIFGREPVAGPATSEAFFAYVHPDDRERLAAGYAQTFGGGATFELDYRIQRPDGAHRVLHALGSRDPNDPAVYRGTVQDVTELRESERRLSLAEARFHSAFANAPMGMALQDYDGRYLMVNDALCRLVGYPAEALLGMSLEDITHPEDRARDIEVRRSLERGEARSLHHEKRYVRADGTLLWVQAHVTLLREDDDNRFLVQVLDVTSRREQEQELRRLAADDGLTGLLNRRAFEQLLAQHLAEVGRYGDRGALLMIDLDNFKALNDTHGHQAGDDVLREVAAVLTSRLRGSDIAARIGGDEFMVLLTQAGPGGAARVAGDIVDHGAGRLAAMTGSGELAVTLSVGVVQLTSAMRSCEAAMAAADAAMYAAKVSGRNRAVVHEAPRPAAEASRR